MAEPVLLISSDPYLGASLEAVAHGRVQVAHLDPADRPPTWVRDHHPGPLVILLNPGERSPVPPDGAQVLGRPFRLIDLVALLERPSVPEVVGEEEDSEQEEHGEHDGEEFATSPPSHSLRKASLTPTQGSPTPTRTRVTPTRRTTGPHSGG